MTPLFVTPDGKKLRSYTYTGALVHEDVDSDKDSRDSGIASELSTTMAALTNLRLSTVHRVFAGISEIQAMQDILATRFASLQ